MRRIALTQRVDNATTYAERRDGLDQRWAEFLAGFGAVPIPLMNGLRPINDCLDALDVNGIILTGGNHLVDVAPDKALDRSENAPERDQFEKRVIKYCTIHKIPLLGVCRGFQILNIYFGGTLVEVKGHVRSRHPLITSEDNVRLPNCVNSYHEYGISCESLADEFEPIAWTQDGVIEAAVHKEYPMKCIMWHPERENLFHEEDLQLFSNQFRLN